MTKELHSQILSEQKIGLLAGNSNFPLRFAEEAKRKGVSVVAVCHKGETDPAIEDVVDHVSWIKVGEVGKLASIFKKEGVRFAAMAGGISRVKLFGGLKLDVRGALLMAKVRSTKDDVVLRGVAEDLKKDDITFVPCTLFLEDCLAKKGVFTKKSPSNQDKQDIEIGIDAIRAMSSQDIGQLVVVKEGVVVAVEAIEGTDKCIKRAGELAGKGCVVVKFSKTTQDMRFDVPTVGVKTIETMREAGASVLAIEAGKCLVLDEEEVVELANRSGISIVGV